MKWASNLWYRCRAAYKAFVAPVLVEIPMSQRIIGDYELGAYIVACTEKMKVCQIDDVIEDEADIKKAFLESCRRAVAEVPLCPQYELEK